MKTVDYRKIDAFTAGQSLGNPAACVLLKPDESLTPDEMLEIAKQHKGFVTEVVYCAPVSDAEFALAYYSSECEVDFCGHGTIACMHGVIAENPQLLGRKEITVHTHKKGTLTVYNEIAANGAVFITAPAPRHIGCAVAAGTIAEHLSLRPDQISPSRPIDVIDAGLRTLIAPVAKLQDEVGVFPNEAVLKSFCEANELDIVLIYSLETKDPANAAHTRVFAPRFGYLEDPATGSGNSAFGHYMLKNKLWEGSPIVLEQGGEDRVFNSINLSTRGGGVLFGGRAATRIKGVYCI